MKWVNFQFFPFINQNETSTLMIRHARLLKKILDNGNKDNVELYEAGVVMYAFDIRYNQLQNIQDTFRIPKYYHLTALNQNDRAHISPRGYITMYRERLSLCFTMYPLF